MGLPRITQDNVHIWIPLKAAEVSSRIAEAEKLSPLEALSKFYNSRTYQLLENEDTKLWYESPISLYEYYLQYQ